MATTTPNYGWTVPTSTDLVKDGATAIETLGDAIDASMNTALGTKKAGMVLLNTTSFSGVASQSFNDVFSATYDNYRIIYADDQTTGSGDLRLRLRVGGTDNSSANYNYSYAYQAGNASANTLNSQRVNNANTANETFAYIGGINSTGGCAYTVLDILNPFLTKRTGWQGLNLFTTTGTNLISGDLNGNISVTTSYTGLTLLVSTGNFGGKVSIYGYNV
jgi:hypothetical protein